MVKEILSFKRENIFTSLETTMLYQNEIFAQSFLPPSVFPAVFLIEAISGRI